MDLKPDVCWQLPLRSEDTVHPDASVTSVVGEWDRVHWGHGGEEFAWWCTEAPEAFRGGTPGVAADARRAVRHGWPGRFRPTGAILGGPGGLRSLAPPPHSPPARVELLRSAIGSKVEAMARKEHWKTEPDEHDYPAAHDYLTLVMSSAAANGLVEALKTAPSDA